MVFDFFGRKRKAVVAMAHIGALPGTPLYDADGGMQRLIDDVHADIEKLQAGGVDAIMFGNENDRREFRARDLHRGLRIRHGGLGARLRGCGAAASQSGPR
jgi:hypothetical protein